MDLPGIITQIALAGLFLIMTIAWTRARVDAIGAVRSQLDTLERVLARAGETTNPAWQAAYMAAASIIASGLVHTREYSRATGLVQETYAKLPSQPQEGPFKAPSVAVEPRKPPEGTPV